MKDRKLQQRCQDLEAEITRLETSIAETESALGTFSSAQETIRLTQLLESNRQDLATRLAEWEQVSAALSS
jgi:chaperonin cofactor prefoldin